TSAASSCSSTRMMARASVDLPAPRSPRNATTSPGLSAYASSSARGAISVSRTRGCIQGAVMRRKEKPHAGGTSSLSCHGLCDRQLCRDLREPHSDPRATAGLGLELHGPAVELDEFLGDRQPKPDAAMLRAEAAAFETLKDAMLQVLRDADPLVFHRENDHAVLPPAGHLDGIARLRETNGVGQQIVDDLPDAGLVRYEVDGVVGNGDVERQTGAARPLADAENGRVEDVPHIDSRELQLDCTCLEGGEVEYVVDDRKQGFRRA